MNQEYKCPYCGQNSYNKTSKKKGYFNNWEAVIAHTSKCDKNNNVFIIHKLYGPILIEYLSNNPSAAIQIKYPLIKLKDVGQLLKHRDKTLYFRDFWSESKIIEAIQNFYKKEGRIPTTRDFYANKKYPNANSVKNKFTTWNQAIIAAGFTPNIQNGFGINTYGKDGHLYRSSAEAYFADNYLFNKVEYIIEPKYPEPFNKWYDWYIPSLDLYIELDGGCRPEVTKEKIIINELLNRDCAFINTSELLK